MYIKPELTSYSTDDLLETLGPCCNQYQAQFTLQSIEFTLSMNLKEPSQKIYMAKVSEKSDCPAKYA